MALTEGIKRLNIPHQYPRKTAHKLPFPRLIRLSARACPALPNPARACPSLHRRPLCVPRSSTRPPVRSSPRPAPPCACPALHHRPACVPCSSARPLVRSSPHPTPPCACPASPPLPVSHAPDVDLYSAVRCPAISEYLVLPTSALAPVENHQMTRFCIATIHVFGGLG